METAVAAVSSSNLQGRIRPDRCMAVRRGCLSLLVGPACQIVDTADDMDKAAAPSLRIRAMPVGPKPAVFILLFRRIETGRPPNHDKQGELTGSLLPRPARSLHWIPDSHVPSSPLSARKGNAMSTPLDGIKIIDFTHVQAGPACTQLLAWFGADVIKIERPGSGDVTRSQLRDLPDQDALYFTMLNSNKKSLTLDTKTAEGKEVLERLIKESDVLVENFAPGALDRMGFSWERIQELNPRLILASVKGFADGHHYEDLKVY